MRRRSPRIALCAALIALLCGAAPALSVAANNCAGGGASRPDEGGIGGTGLRPGDSDDEDDSGVGGTGARPSQPDDDSGVGGTGVSAQGDTGIIGTITGFASICVGEVEIHYTDDAPVQVDGRTATTAQLAVGQVVEVVADGSGANLEARQITVRHIVVGPITASAPERDEVGVAGQVVRLSPATRGEGAAALTAEAFPLGTVVQVSGLRQADGSIAASRVSHSDAATVRLDGAVDRAADGGAAVAGTPVRLAPGMQLDVGEEVRVSGQWRVDHLMAEAIERVTPVPFDGRVARVEIEGYAVLSAPEQLRVGPYRFQVSRGALATLPELGSARPVRVEAVVRDRRAVVERIDAAPELPPRPPRGEHGELGGQAGRPADAAGRDARPPREAHGDRPPGGARGMGMALPDRPARPERPSGPDLPERPPHIERPAAPDRPDLPVRPDRPPRPGP